MATAKISEPTPPPRKNRLARKSPPLPCYSASWTGLRGREHATGAGRCPRERLSGARPRPELGLWPRPYGAPPPGRPAPRPPANPRGSAAAAAARSPLDHLPVHCGKPEPAAEPALTPGGRVRELPQGWRGRCARTGRARGGAGRSGGPRAASAGCLLPHIPKRKINDAFEVPRAPSRVVV